MAITFFDAARALSISQLIEVFLCLGVLCLLSRFVYNAFFHPLAVFPGPLLYGGSEIPRLIQEWQGNTIHKWAELHNKYGTVVRIAPDQLSYISPNAWRDIYGERGLFRGPVGDGPTPQMKKEELEFPGDDFEFFEAKPMISCDAANHARHRRIIGHAFSDRAIRDFEPRIVDHVDLLMARLQEHALTHATINIVDWFNFTTFDITSELTFGDSFGCLVKSKYHSWVARVFPGMRLIAWSSVIAKFPGLGRLIQWVIPKRIVEEANAHIQMVVDLTNKRISVVPDRPDFMTHILHNNGRWCGASLSKDELYLDSQLLVIAGSETTATLLSGAVYYLSRNEDVMIKLKEILRSTFQIEAEITPVAVSRVPYLVAVINECLRMYPPGAINMPRTVPPGGATIDGKFVPAGSVVGLAQFAAYRSPLHFTQPLKFDPERWQGDVVYANDNKDVFQPFSYGPRNCIGRNLAVLEIRFILAKVLWKFDLEVLSGQEGWPNQKTYLSWVKPPLMLRLKHVIKS